MSASAIGMANDSSPNAMALRLWRANSPRSSVTPRDEHEVEQPERAQELERRVALQQARHARPGDCAQRDQPDESGNPKPFEEQRPEEQNPHRDGDDEDRIGDGEVGDRQFHGAKGRLWRIRALASGGIGRFSGLSVDLSGSTPVGIDKVEARINSGAWQPATVDALGNYSASGVGTLAAGPNLIEARVTASTGAVATSTDVTTAANGTTVTADVTVNGSGDGGTATCDASLTPAAAAGSYNVIEGTNGPDTLSGTSGPDAIFARGGNDTVKAKGGDDCVLGGNGKDRVNGGPGDDVILTGDGRDRVHAGTGDDTVDAGNGLDVVFGDAGDDTLDGGRDNDLVVGADGDDDILGNHGYDVLIGGPGVDTIDGGAHDDRCKTDADDPPAVSCP